MNYYDILEINNTASEEVIKAAYKALVKKYHPDSFKKSDTSLPNKEIKLIIEAYETLSNPQKREAYDMALLTEKDSTKHNEDSSKTNSTTKASLNILSNILSGIGNEICNSIDIYRQEIENSYMDGLHMDNHKLILKHKNAYGAKRTGYAKAMVEKDLLIKDDKGYKPTPKYYLFK